MPYHTIKNSMLYRSYSCWPFRSQRLLAFSLGMYLTACGPQALIPSASHLTIMGGQTLSATHPLSRVSVHLQFQTPAGLEVCTGTLLATNWVLTAAHCVSESYRVFRYQGSALDTSKSVGGHANPLLDEPIHVEAWKESGYQLPLSDLLLVHLHSPLRETSEDYPTITQSPLLESGPWTILGTGAHLDQVNITHELRSLELKTLELDSSLQMISSPGRPINKGDSGGGLFVKRGESYELIGVLSGSIDYRARWTAVYPFRERVLKNL